MAWAAHHRDWVVGFQDEVWWSRLAQPRLHAWGAHPLRLVAKGRGQTDPEPKTRACYGGVRSDRHPMRLRFVDGRPVSALTIDFLTWVCGRLAQARKRVFVLVWDNATWHGSQAVRAWVREHKRAVKRGGKGVRILDCRLPFKSPWLNPIEPRWAHGTRASVEPARTLTPDELESRVCSS